MPLTYKKLLELPVNLRKKAIREARNRNEIIPGAPKPRRRRRRRDSAMETVRIEHAALVASTERVLKKILSECELLSDIPYDCTPEELLGEIAIAEGHATTLFIERDGLSTLTVNLHQLNPTIANLKHAIAKLSVAEHKRTQRERHEERLQRRRRDTNIDEEQQLVSSTATPRSTGELVCSATRNGHKHRGANVSWRFLWHAYTLYNVDTQTPINDENGRALLADLGIENAATLRFCHRVKYFGRKRQK